MIQVKEGFRGATNVYKKKIDYGGKEQVGTLMTPEHIIRRGRGNGRKTSGSTSDVVRLAMN
jgi:hypothetical protein